MNREEYINQLKNNLSQLSEEEITDAVNYYSAYFEEAGDDQKVISELGSPQELSESIKEKISKEQAENFSEQKEGDGAYKSQKSSDALYYEFDSGKVKNLYLNFGTADIVMISGNNFAVETRGVEKDALNCYLGSDGTLTVNNSRRLNLNFFSAKNNRLIPRILLTFPKSAELEKFKITIGAGNCRGKDILLKCNSGKIDVGAGNLVLKSVIGGKIDFHCGMGNLDFEGRVTGKSSVDCGMGAVKLNLKGDESDYSYDLKLGLGDFKFNDEKKSGVGQMINNNQKENHFSVKCDMGSVNIKIS